MIGVTGLLLVLTSAAHAQVSGPAFVFGTGTVINATEVNTDLSTIYTNALNRFSGVMAGALTFSPDNTFDIGASLATRPRDLFLGRNATIGGTLAVTGAVTFGGAVTFSGGASSIPETAITDGTILARVAGTETITGPWTFTHVTGPRIDSTSPSLIFTETDAAANNGHYRFVGDSGGTFTFQTLNDAENSASTVFSIARSGTTVSSMTIAPTVLLTGCTGATCLTTPSIATSANPTSGIALFQGATSGIGVINSGTSVTTLTNHLTLSAGVISQTSTTGVGLSIAAGGGFTPAVFDRTGGDGTIVDFRSGGATQGTVSIAGATTAYNTFMGAHYTQLQPGQGEFDQGMVMVSAGRAIHAKPRRLTKAVRMLNAEGLAIGEQTVDVGPAPVNPDAERFVYVERSSRRNQKGVYGVWFADLGRTAAGMSWGDPDAEVYQVAGLGLYTVWVTETCGPIATGNLLATSPIAGLAERQCQAGMPMDSKLYDPVVRDHTLGKALVDVDWKTVEPDEDGIRKVRIPVVLMAG